MTREEAIVLFEKQLTAAQVVLDSGFGSNPGENDSLYRRRKEMAEIALSVLRPVSREQVRRGTIIETIKDGRANRVFSCCGHDFTELTCWFMPDFCPSCGAPMTDEAVDIIMRRLEALKDAAD